MLAEKNKVFDECVYTLAQLSEDEKIRQQCEARLDAIAKENGLYSRGRKEGIKEGIKQGVEQGIRQVYINMRKSGIEKTKAQAFAELDDKTVAEIEKELNN